MSRVRVFAVLLLPGLVLTALGVSAPAPAVVYPERSAYIFDGSGDATDGLPHHDIVAATVDSDPNSGTFSGYVDLAGPPPGPNAGRLVVWYGNWDPVDPNTCVGTVHIDGAFGARPSVERGTASARGAISLGAGSQGREPRSAERAGEHRISYSVSSATAVGQQFTCVFARITAVDGPSIYDQTDADQLDDKGPASLLAIGETSRLKKGKWGKARVTVINVGDSTARETVLTLAKPPKQVDIKARTVRVPDIAPDGEVSVAVRVRMTKAGEKNLQGTVTAHGAQPETASLTVQVAPEPPPATGNLAGTFLWAIGDTPYVGWDTRGVLFLDRKWAYRGFPEGGVPHCRKRTATPEGDGCVPYWFDRRTKKLQVDIERTKFKKPLKLDGETYAFPLAAAEKGKRYAFDLSFNDYYGCEGGPACTTYTGYVSLRRDGTLDYNGTPGTYRMLSRGRLKVSFATGARQIFTLLIGLDKSGRPDPAGEGVFLDGRYYYTDD